MNPIQGFKLLSMRIVKETQVMGLKVTIFLWNNKYLVKFEDGSSELTYKISQMDLTSESDVDIFLTNEEVLNKVRESFESMRETLRTFYDKI